MVADLAGHLWCRRKAVELLQRHGWRLLTRPLRGGPGGGHSGAGPHAQQVHEAALGAKGCDLAGRRHGAAGDAVSAAADLHSRQATSMTLLLLLLPDLSQGLSTAHVQFSESDEDLRGLTWPASCVMPPCASARMKLPPEPTASSSDLLKVC